MRILLFVLASLFVVSGHNLYARDYAEKVRLMKLNAKTKCSFSLDYTLQTKSGLSTPDKTPDRVQLFEGLRPKPSSSSDFAIYSLAWENDDYLFSYYMNSQVGEIRILSKAKGIEAESALDLSDMGKEELIIGKVRLTVRENIKVTHPVTRDQVDGEKYTDLVAICVRDN